uniref:Uncharacterized protein n=1 Tax=Triticum urartu TaxID=4572 RepID=A0A8R7QJ56_TRIUA
EKVQGLDKSLGVELPFFDSAFDSHLAKILSLVTIMRIFLGEGGGEFTTHQTTIQSSRSYK